MNKNLNSLYILILISLITISFLNDNISDSTYLKSSFLALLILFFTYFYSLSMKNYKIVNNKIYLYTLFAIGAQILYTSLTLYFIEGVSYYGFLVSLTGVYSVFILSINVRWNKSHLTLVSLLFLVLALTQFLLLVKSPTLDFFAGSFENSNRFGKIMFLSFLIHYLSFKYSKKVSSKAFWLIAISLDVLLIVQSNTRSIMGSIIILLIIGYFYKKTKISERLHKLVFVILIIIVGLIPVTIISLDNSPNKYLYNDWVIEKTGKSLFSGRETLWSNAIENMDEKYMFGQGYGTEIYSITGTELSTHNTYLQLFFLGGIVGVLLFILLLYLIWLGLYDKEGENPFLPIMGSFIIMSSFEIYFYQSAFSYSLIMFLIMGMGLSINYRKGVENESNRGYSSTLSVKSFSR